MTGLLSVRYSLETADFSEREMGYSMIDRPEVSWMLSTHSRVDKDTGNVEYDVDTGVWRGLDNLKEVEGSQGMYESNWAEFCV